MPNNKDMEALGALLGLGIVGAMLDSDKKPGFEDVMRKAKQGQPNPFNADPAAMAKKSASTAKQLYDAYVEAGFTENQAFELVKGILTAKTH